MLAAILGVLGPVIGQVVKSVFPDPADKLKAQELENQLQVAIMARAGELERAASDIVKTEAQSEGFLTRSWRPLTMLTFVSLIVAKWLGYTAPGISEALEIKLLGIIEIGLGGYVIGRSVERIAPAIAQAVSQKAK